MTLTSLEKRMLIYVLDLFDGGGAEAPKAPLESATAVPVSHIKNSCDFGLRNIIPHYLDCGYLTNDLL